MLRSASIDTMLTDLRFLGLFLCLCILAGCSKSPGELYQLGQQSHAQGDLPTAIVHLKSAIQKAPDDAAIRFALGRVHNDAYDGVAAEAELKRALDLGASEGGLVQAAHARALWLQGKHDLLAKLADPGGDYVPTARAELFAYRGHGYVALGKPAEAKEEALRARQALAGNALPLVDLLEANILASERDAKAAMAIIERVLKAHPRLFDALALKADLVRVTGDSESAVAAYGDLLAVHPSHLLALVGRSTLLAQAGKFDDAEKDVRTLKAAYKDHFITHFQEGLLRFRKGQFPTALESFHRVLKINPQHEIALLYEGMTQLFLGSALSARRSLAQYHAARPDDVLGRRMLATAFVQMNESTRALEIIAPVLDAGESRPEFWELAADAYTRLGNLEKASEWLAKVEQAKPEDSAVQEKQGALNVRRGRVDLALSDYAAAAKLSSRLTTADTMLVILNLRARDFERAHAAVRAMEKKAPGDVFVQNLKGVVLLEQGRWTEAAAAFEEVLKKQPSHLPAAANLARLDLRERNVDRARKRFEAVLAADKTHMQALLALAGFERSLGRHADAVKALERAATAYPAALEPRAQLVDLLIRQGDIAGARVRAEEAATRNPTNAAALELLAGVKLREGDKHSAVATLMRIAEMHPNVPAVHVARARVERIAGMTKEAEASLRKALELNKGFAPAQVQLFELLMQHERFSQAIELAKTIRAEFPRSPVGYVFAGEIAVAQKRYKEAVEHYRTALSVARTPDLANRLYHVRVLAGEGKEAFSELRRWADEHPRFPQARAQLGIALLEQGDYKNAVGEFTRVLRATPADPAAANNLAWALYKSGNLEQAIPYAEGAYKLSPADPHVNDTLGWLLLEQGNVSRALALLAKSAVMLKDQPDVRYRYAAALAKSGDNEKARAELRAALALKTSFDERDQANALLARLEGK